MQEAKRKEGLTFELSIPHGMSGEEVAKVFAVYLASPIALPRMVLSWGRLDVIRRAPPYINPGFPAYWQLDDANEFWLVEIPEEKKVQLSCRHNDQTDICEAMVRLFATRHY
jgi:hypothetical protein